jgi:hypothetical protein
MSSEQLDRQPGEWAGATSRWHIPSYKRDQADPSGPHNWPRRPPDIAGFCNSIGPNKGVERKHAYDPPSGLPHPCEREQQWKSTSKHVEPYQPLHERMAGRKILKSLAHDENQGWTGTRNNFTGPRHFSPLVTTMQPEPITSTKSYFVEKVFSLLPCCVDTDMTDIRGRTGHGNQKSCIF